MAEPKAWATSAGSFLAALVASSHHSLHMGLISLGVGGASTLFSPTIRRVMILASIAMAALAGAWGLRRGSPAQKAGVAASVILSVALVAWTVSTHGW